MHVRCSFSPSSKEERDKFVYDQYVGGILCVQCRKSGTHFVTSNTETEAGYYRLMRKAQEANSTAADVTDDADAASSDHKGKGETKESKEAQEANHEEKLVLSDSVNEFYRCNKCGHEATVATVQEIHDACNKQYETAQGDFGWIVICIMFFGPLKVPLVFGSPALYKQHIQSSPQQVRNALEAALDRLRQQLHPR